jgi:hypothetical protein
LLPIRKLIEQRLRARAAQPQPSGRLLRPDAGNRYDLRATLLSGDHLHGRTRNREQIGEQTNQGLVGRALDWRCAEAHAQCVAVDAGELRPRGTRLDPEPEVDAVGSNG